MQNVNTKIQNFLEKHKIEKRHLFILSLLSAMVIIIVCVSLITPAISMSGNVICGMEEHSHDEQCFVKTLVCTLPVDSGHQHSDECYMTETELICGMEENADHIHTEKCYSEKKILTCDVLESTGHIHNEHCYEINLICGKEEHSHTVECYEIPPSEIIAGESELDGAEPELADADQNDTEPEEIVHDHIDAEKNAKLLDAQTFAADAVVLNGDTTVINDISVDFGNFIKKIEHKEIAGNVTNEVKEVKFTINYSLPGSTLMNNNENRQIYCLLPENVFIDDPKTGIVRREGQEIGTYKITHDGYVIIDFDPNFVKDGKTPISGDVSFNANVIHQNAETDFENVTIGKSTVVIPFPAEPAPSEDLSVSKMLVGEYDKDNHKAHYKIEIKSWNGSGIGDITLNDEFLGEHKDLIKHDWNNGDTVTLTKNDGTTITATVEIKDDGSTAITGIPPLNANESYSLEYTATVKDDNATPIIKANNRANVTNGKLTDTTDCNTQIAINCGISKNGQYNSKTDMLEWTIKVTNPSGGSLDGYTITDDMLGNTANGLVITDANGNPVETLNAENNWIGAVGNLDTSTNTFAFSSSSGGAGYTLFYETKLPDRNAIPAGNQVSNKAILKHDDIQVNAPEAKPWISDDRQYVYKSLGKTFYDSSGNIVADWMTKLEFQVGDFVNQVFTDTISTGGSDEDHHYMMPSQKDSLAVVGYDASSVLVNLTSGTDYTVTWCDKEGNTITNETDNIYSFKIAFAETDAIKSLCDVHISYSTLGITAGMVSGDEREYRNQAAFMEKTSTASCWEKKKEPFYKYDCSISGQPSKEEQTLHNANELEKTADGELILKWYITANESHSWSDTEDAVLTDILPKGVKLNENAVTYGISPNNGNSYEIVRGAPVMHTTSIVADGHQSVVFNIPAGFHGGKPFRIQYEVLVSEEYLINNKDQRGNTYFKNKVTDGHYTSEQTQIIERTLITKTGDDPSNIDDGYINYNIDVNPKAETLSNNGKITLTDTMNYQYMAFVPTLTALDVYSVSTDENGIEILTPLDTSLYKLKTSNDAIDAKFVIELPDKMHLKVVYTYHCVYKDASITEANDYGTRVFNSAVLEFDDNTQKATHNQSYQLTKQSSAHAVTGDNIKICKVDSENYGIKLEGAGFSVYRWDGSKWLTMTDISVNEEHNNIKTPVWGGEEGTEGITPYIISTDDTGRAEIPYVESGVIYKILEQTAPTDYIKSQFPYYFAFNSAPTEFLPTDNEFNAKDVQILYKGGIINIPNVKMKKTEIGVQKYWHEASGFTGEHGDINVELYQSKTDPSGKVDGPEITFTYSDPHGHSGSEKVKMPVGSNVTVKMRTWCSWLYGDGININGESINWYAIPVEHQGRLSVPGMESGTPTPQTVLPTHFAHENDALPDNWYEVEGWYSEYEVTYKNVTEAMSLGFYFGNSSDISQYHIVVDVTEPEAITGIPEDAVLIETAVLNSYNSWTYEWNNIPATDEFGYKYYYYVQEKAESIPAGYTVSYDNNGLNSGMISITNTGQGYTNEMPATGGTGVKRIETIGAILVSGSVSLYFLINRRSRKTKT